jgi:hypothetical protein
MQEDKGTDKQPVQSWEIKNNTEYQSQHWNTGQNNKTNKTLKIFDTITDHVKRTHIKKYPQTHKYKISNKQKEISETFHAETRGCDWYGFVGY